MTCKDCIHHKICECFYEDEGTPLMASLCKEGDICNQFENKSEYIKLPQIDKQDYIDVVKSISKAMANLADRLSENN